MKKLKIGIDVDGVLYPFIDEFKKYCEKQLDKKLPEVENWNFYRNWKLTNRQFMELYASFINADCLEVGAPENNSKETIDKLSKDGHEIYIITHRLFDAFDLKTKTKSITSTVNWLNKNDIYFDHIIFIKDKSLVDLDLLLDDGIHNLEDFKNEVICFSRPWNKNWNYTKVNNWNEFYKKIINEIYIPF